MTEPQFTDPKSRAAYEAFTEAGAEMSIKMMKSRRWLVIALPLLIGTAFLASGIGLVTQQSDSVIRWAGCGFAAIGIIIYILGYKSYKKLCGFIQLYDDKLADSD